jgi:type IV pilus assembly protein PilC
MEWSELFDPILIQIIHVWEETWTITEVLSKISWFYKEQLQNKIDVMMWFLEPILMIFIAGMVWAIVAAVFIPMASIVEVL